MARQLSTMIPNEGSVIREMFNAAEEKPDIISFAVGEPGYGPSPFVADAMIRAIEDDQTYYTSNAGIKPLREAISQHAKVERGLSYDPEGEIIVTCGAMEALFLAFRTLLNDGDGVLVPDPGFPNYLNQITILGGEVQPYTLREEAGFRVTAADVEAAIRPNTKVLLLNCPSNPTGAIIDEDELDSIARLAEQYDLWVVTDEVYRDFCYVQDGSVKSIATQGDDAKQRTIVVDSFSKTYAMTGIRVGYACGPKEVIEPMTTMQEDVVSCVATPCQIGGLAALQDANGPIAQMKQQYLANRNKVLEAVEHMPGVTCPSIDGAFYAFLNIRRTGLSSRDFAMKLLHDKDVAVVPGNGFGDNGEGFIRLSFVGKPDDISEGLSRMQNFTQELARQQHA